MPEINGKDFYSAVFIEDNSTNHLRDVAGRDKRRGTVVISLPNGSLHVYPDILRAQFYKWVALKYDGQSLPDGIELD